MKFSIEYNPIKKESIFKKDGKLITNPRSKFTQQGKWASERLQSWIDQLPDALEQELNSKKIDLEFIGTKLDFEDITEMASRINDSNHFEVNLSFSERMINDDALNVLQQIYEDIQTSNIEDLNINAIQQAYKQAMSNKLEVNIIATMSAGKSTLVNSLLQKKVLPSRNEATTAKVMRIRDNDAVDSKVFHARAFNHQRQVIKECSNINEQFLNRLNDDSAVSTIEIEGNVPFVNNDMASLVLVDTPGPNNSQDESHAEKTKEVISNSPKTLIVYVMNGTQILTNDDDSLFKFIAASMKASKEKRDRFLFVVNKLDASGKEDDINATLENIRKHLKNKYHIENPQIVAASAKTALGIRDLISPKYSSEKLLKKLKDCADDEENEELEDAVDATLKIYKRERLHMTNYGFVSESIKREIQDKISRAEKEGNIRELALLYTGIPTVEAIIRTYVEKYAKFDRLEAVTNSFQKELEKFKNVNELKKEIYTKEEAREKAINQIDKLKNMLKLEELTQKFEKRVQNLDLAKAVNEEFKHLNRQFQDEQTDKQIELQNSQKYREISKNNQNLKNDLTDELNRYAKDQQENIRVRIRHIIYTQIDQLVKKMYTEFKDSIMEIDQNLELEDFNIKNLSGDFFKSDTITASIDLAYEKAGSYEVGVSTWYKPSTWFKKETFIDGNEVIQKFFIDFVDNVSREAKDMAQKLTIEAQGQAKQKFDKAIKEVQRSLQEVVAKLEKATKEAKQATLAAKRLRQDYDREIAVKDMIAKLESVTNLVEKETK